jgi:hypothetical protein
MRLLADTNWLVATYFNKVDTNSNARALAAAAKMKLFPDLADADRERLLALR